MSEREIIVDSFAGGGGASLGITWALGRSPDIAINHDRAAIALHAANHPDSEHYPENVWAVDPVTACRGRPVGLQWLSPDCTHFSRAKGGKPVKKKIRGLAWVAVRWAKAVRPRVIVLENVEEFKGWGPVRRETGQPCPVRKGKTFRAFVRKLQQLGYCVDHRELRACDYGAPTSRKRLFLIARCDGKPIVWPKPTHGPTRAQPHRFAAECIDWTIPCPSIFLTKAEAKAQGFGRIKRPLVENTLCRVGRGVGRFVLHSPRPFIVGIDNQSSGESPVWDTLQPLRTITTENRFALVAPTLVHIGNGEREGQAPRALDITRPMNTVVGSNKFALVTAFLAKHYTGVVGASLFDPIPTITAVDHHSLVTATFDGGADRRQQVRAFLTVYYGTPQNTGNLFEPMPTVVGTDRLGLVTVEGSDYALTDIGLRMLVPRELARGQGFPDSYKLDIRYRDDTGRMRRLSKRDQVNMIGNSVNPDLAEAIVRANVELGARERAA